MRPPDDEPLGPDSFPGDDSESHYAAPAMWREVRAHLGEPSRPPQAREHDLKLAADLFEDVRSGRKTFELRRNDRNFQVGDVLWLRAWDGVAYDGRSHRVKVTYLTDGSRFGALQPGFICMSVEPVA